MEPYKQKSCKVGMKFREPSRCVSEAMAKECLKKNHPKWLMKCPKPKVDDLGPLPVMKEAVLRCKETKGKLKTTRKKYDKAQIVCDAEVPRGDWNPDSKF
ncbi:unnamed protein product [Ceutorhynchus assimilis]|uniref:Uncharacterized protein n=1 Tax=Ceutorhynchus assimilis TaxID=467358 RepID=A0A9N9MR69_9CUCU|nr:unnamed protein product [Ceutorhynchus assimilis]